MTTMFTVALGLLVLTCLADVWTTAHGLRRGLVERNIVVRWATQWPWLLYVIKALFTIVTVAQLYVAYAAYPGWTVAVTLVSAWLTGFVALRNVKLAAIVREGD